MSEPLENLYFNWLCSKVLQVRRPTPSLSFDTLFKTLHNLEFVWLLSGDDNRAEDGKELRREFFIMGNIPDDEEWRTQIPCSVFEMLIGFSRRADKNSRTSAKEWFWEFLKNLNLAEANDASGIEPNEIQDVIEMLLWRTYGPDGDGGLFPLRDPQRDQSEQEIWQQFCDYLVDQNRLP
jgi:hypothetical protein